jgi:hypothetical protein
MARRLVAAFDCTGRRCRSAGNDSWQGWAWQLTAPGRLPGSTVVGFGAGTLLCTQGLVSECWCAMDMHRCAGDDGTL